MSEDPYEKIVTWNDVYYQTVGLGEEAEEQMDSGWGEEGVCTYEGGYKDQAIYSCRTCAEVAGRRVGVCYGCYLECHLGHDMVVELFTRRKFRCDCPTLCDSIGDCALFQGDSKDLGINEENKYTANFDDVFCWCRRGYSADSNATLIECHLCEDWFHPECIRINDPLFIHALDDDDDVFVCKPCLIKAPILLRYSHLLSSNLLPSSSHSSSSSSNPSSSSTLSSSHIESKGDNKDDESKHSSLPQSTHSHSPLPPSSPSSCILPSLKNTPLISSHALFKAGWTHHLCKCSDCQKEMENLSISFLLSQSPPDPLPNPSTSHDPLVDVEMTSPEDERPANETLAEAVRRNHAKRSRSPSSPSSFDPLLAGIEAFSALPHHEAKGNVLHAYDQFAQELETFFKNAADKGTVLTAKDIYSFFDQLKRSTHS